LVYEAYDAMKAVRNAGNTISVVWIPMSAENELLKIAKGKAKEATQQIAIHVQHAREPGMRSTTLRVAWAKRASVKSLPENVGRNSKRVDTALPGKHTRRYLLLDVVKLDDRTPRERMPVQQPRSRIPGLSRS
jgi:hypothetical protein